MHLWISYMGALSLDEWQWLKLKDSTPGWQSLQGPPRWHSVLSTTVWRCNRISQGLLQYRICFLKLKSHEFSFYHNLSFSCQIILKFCSEHGSTTAVLCAKFQNDLTTAMDDLNWQDFFERFEFKMHFGSYPKLSNHLEICSKYGSVTAMLCTKFQNDLTTAINDLNWRDFARF